MDYFTKECNPNIISADPLFVFPTIASLSWLLWALIKHPLYNEDLHQKAIRMMVRTAKMNDAANVTSKALQQFP